MARESSSQFLLQVLASSLAYLLCMHMVIEFYAQLNAIELSHQLKERRQIELKTEQIMTINVHLAILWFIIIEIKLSEATVENIVIKLKSGVSFENISL